MAQTTTSSKPEVQKLPQEAQPAKPRSVPASKRPASPTDIEERAARTQAPTAVQPVEPEDAYLTGTSRSLQRRLLGLNVEGSRPLAKPVPEATSPGLHSTGSYTETPASPIKSSNREKK